MLILNSEKYSIYTVRSYNLNEIIFSPLLHKFIAKSLHVDFFTKIDIKGKKFQSRSLSYIKDKIKKPLNAYSGDGTFVRV